MCIAQVLRHLQTIRLRPLHEHLLGHGHDRGGLAVPRLHLLRADLPGLVRHAETSGGEQPADIFRNIIEGRIIFLGDFD